jgi:hypothetical protein
VSYVTCSVGDGDFFTRVDGIPYFGEQGIEGKSGLGDGGACVVLSNEQAAGGIGSGVSGVNSDSIKTHHAKQQR